MSFLRFFPLCAALALAPAAHAQFGDLLRQVGGDKADTIVDNFADGKKLVKSAAGIGLEEERSLGGSVAVEIVSRYGGLVRDEALLRRVNLVGRSLAQYSDRPTLAWRFGVLNSPTVNAFSAPSGYVFITRGLYALAGDDDDLLAAILAHEIIHITQKHALNLLRGSAAASGALGIAARNAKGNGLRQAQDAAGQLGLDVDRLIEGFVVHGFAPETEYTADAQGRALAATCGYRATGLREILVKVQNTQGDPATLFSTHPPLAERIQRLR